MDDQGPPPEPNPQEVFEKYGHLNSWLVCDNCDREDRLWGPGMVGDMLNHAASCSPGGATVLLCQSQVLFDPGR